MIYTGPGPLLYRRIAAPFADDPNWADPLTPAPDDSVTFTMSRGVTVPANAVLTFGFLDAGGMQVAGGSASADEFFVVPRYGYGFGYEDTARPVVLRGQVVVVMDLALAWVMTISGPTPHGVRLYNIGAPAGAAILLISVQELPR